MEKQDKLDAKALAEQKGKQMAAARAEAEAAIAAHDARVAELSSFFKCYWRWFPKPPVFSLNGFSNFPDENCSPPLGIPDGLVPDEYVPDEYVPVGLVLSSSDLVRQITPSYIRAGVAGRLFLS